jgi:hypothetical protein
MAFVENAVAKIMKKLQVLTQRRKKRPRAKVCDV